MKHLERRSRLTLGALVVLALATAAVGVYAVASADSGAQPSPIESLRAGPGGPGVFARASDLNPAAATRSSRCATVGKWQSWRTPPPSA